MAYNDEVRLVDVFGGMQDLNHHLIRCVGIRGSGFPKMRCGSSGPCGFPPSLISDRAGDGGGCRGDGAQPPQYQCGAHPGGTGEASGFSNPERIRDAYELGITKVILPEWDAMEGWSRTRPTINIRWQSIRALKNVKQDKVLRLTMLFHDMGKPRAKTTDENGRDHFKGHALISEKIAGKALRRLKFDNETIRKVTRLVCYHDYRMEATPKNVRRAMNRIGVELFPYYLAVRLADVKAQSPYRRREKIENIVAARELYRKALLEDECVTLRQLAVSGRELMDLGMKPGRELGEHAQ